ncbi:ribokinase [Microbacterium sp.]|uniref:ribokinase n=1 Tax=Microbacterium sp. TaxID=51671 RepID=UPI0035689142
MSDVVVLGSANMDLVVRQPRLPRPGETIWGSGFSAIPGGKGLNQAVAAARGGADVAFLGCVGDDAFGSDLRACLRLEGIDDRGLERVLGPTGTAHVSVLDDGENAIVVVPGANHAVDALDDGMLAAISSARCLVAQLERPVPLVHAAFRAARDRGVSTVLTPAPVTVLPPGLLELTDILVPNAGEARELAGADDDLEAARMLSRSAATVVMTRGADGAVVAERGEIVSEVPARRVVPVDTTAAGDTFVGTLVARLVAGSALPRALEAASIAASIAVTRAGATTSMPRWEEVSGLLPPR